MVCKYCGAENPAESKFCIQCGKPLITSDTGAVNNAVSDLAAQQQIKRAYRLFKARAFLAHLSLACLIIPFFVQAKIANRIIVAVILVVICGVLYAWVEKKHKAVSFYKLNDNGDFLQEAANYTPMFGNKLRGIYIASVITAVLVFILCLADYTFWESAKFAITMALVMLVVLSAIWAFKALGVILSIIGLIVVTGFALSDEDTDTAEGGASSSQSYKNNGGAEILGAYLSEYGSREIVIVSYQWTNTDSAPASAAFHISVHAYQDGIELKKAYFADYDNEMADRDIQKGVTIQAEAAFYLDSLSDVEVQITPWVSFDDEVYVREFFTFS